MKKSLPLFAAMVLSLTTMRSFAQLIPDGSTAPNFTFKDMNGKTQDLYTYLNAGKPVVIDISATWCHPCWLYHESGELENFYNQKGPPGTNEAMVIFVEGDDSTSDGCMIDAGCIPTLRGGTEGNWVAGTPYPMCNPPAAEIDLFMEACFPPGNYAYFPAVFLVCTDKKIKNLDQLTASELNDALATCPSPTSTKDIDLNAYVSVFPNPSNGNVFVNINAVDKGTVNVKIYNVMGEIISQAVENTSITKNIKFDLTQQPDGMYFVEVRSGSARTIKKIMLNK